jgi:hypothetical protein
MIPEPRGSGITANCIVRVYWEGLKLRMGAAARVDLAAASVARLLQRGPYRTDPTRETTPRITEGAYEAAAALVGTATSVKLVVFDNGTITPPLV